MVEVLCCPLAPCFTCSFASTCCCVLRYNHGCSTSVPITLATARVRGKAPAAYQALQPEPEELKAAQGDLEVRPRRGGAQLSFPKELEAPLAQSLPAPRMGVRMGAPHGGMGGAPISIAPQARSGGGAGGRSGRGAAYYAY